MRGARGSALALLAVVPAASVEAALHVAVHIAVDVAAAAVFVGHDLRQAEGLGGRMVGIRRLPVDLLVAGQPAEILALGLVVDRIAEVVVVPVLLAGLCLGVLPCGLLPVALLLERLLLVGLLFKGLLFEGLLFLRLPCLLYTSDAADEL